MFVIMLMLLLLNQQFHNLLVLNIHDVVKDKLSKSEVEICKFLTRERLGKLLTDTKDKDKCGAIADLLNKLLKKTGEEDIVKQVDKLVKSRLGYTINYGDVEENETSCKYPWRELFVWALLFNRPELADLFWKRTNNNTAMALVARILLHSLAKEAEEKALCGSLNSCASEFEKRAIEVLNQCYKDNKLDSQELVKMKMDECGDKSILMIADVEYMEFMYETCCDVVIQNKWAGKLYEPTQFEDLLKFLRILALFIVSYGVASRALLFPKSELSWALLRDIVYLPYWQMYGDLQLEEIEDAKSPEGLKGVAIVLFAVYMMMSHILLLNLLIATFTHSINRIHDEKKKSWHFGFRSLVREYEGCSIYPPPFSILEYFYQLCRWQKRGSGQPNITKCKKERRQELQQFEKGKMWKYLNSLKKAPVAEHADEAIVARLQSLEETVNTLHGMLEEIKNSLNRHVIEPT